MSSCAARRRWRFGRVCLRGLRLGFLLLALVVLAAFVYLNKVGLPDFLKRPLVEGVRARGVDLQFSRLRWRWYRGFVAENVRFGPAQPEADAPRLSLKEVELKVNHAALARFSVKVDALILHDGQLVWRLEETNQPPESLSVTNIQSQVRFLPNDQWELNHFTASFAGAKLRLSGSVTNASRMREWRIFHGQAEAAPELLRQRLRALAKAIDRIKFAQPPELNVTVNGDAGRLHSFNGLVTLDAPAAETPWGTLTNGALLARLLAPSATNNLPVVEFSLHAGEAGTPWGSARQFRLKLHATGDGTVTNLARARMDISAAQFTTQWAQAVNVRFSARWTHSLTNPIPDGGTAELRATDAHSRWGSAGELRLNANLSTPTNNGPPRADASWGRWACLEPYFLDWNCRLENIQAEDFKSQELVCGGSWRAPELTLTNLHTEMYQGRLDASASLNAATRAASFECVSDFDVRKAIPFLTPGGRDWFQRQQFEWEKPPLIHANGSVTLPAWTNQHPDWRAEVLPTLRLAGDFQVGAASYRGAPVSSAQSHLTYSNLVCNLPDLVATRPEGNVDLAMVSDDRTSNYFFRVHSTVDVKLLRGWLEGPQAQRAVDGFIFTQPPLIDAEIWGRWHDRDRTGGKATVTISNFVARGESATYFHSALDYTNRFLVLTDARVERTNQYLTASGMGFDFMAQKAYLTNGFSAMDALPVLHAIGPKVTKTMEPYHFLQPPTVSAYGVIPLSDDTSVADLHFKIDGGPFEWLKFHLPRISGAVDWVGQGMTLSNVQASFYEGKLTGAAAFDFRRKVGTDFQFDTLVTDARLGALMADVAQGTNHLEGILSGRLNITHASSTDSQSWFGNGVVDLRDGLIWEIPIFGILSQGLDKISPGLGNTRASEGGAVFIITNSVIRSDDLEIRSPMVRLLYRGTVDFDKKVDATVYAQVGRDTPVLGWMLSTVLSPFSWLFETKVTGSLNEPKSEPVRLMTKMLNPFIHPWRTLKDIFPGETDTNTPPAWPSEKKPAAGSKAVP